jgi:hypothetical protein
VKKVLDGLNSGSGILDPQLNKWQYLKGPGARTLDSHDVACLIILLRQNPSRTLESYRRELFYATGTITSTSTICRFCVCPFFAIDADHACSKCHHAGGSHRHQLWAMEWGI